MSERTIEAIDRFHAHLDHCTQCRTTPFDLCPEGRRRLLATGLMTLQLVPKPEPP